MGAWVRSPFCKRALLNKTFPRKNLVPQARATCFSPWLCDFSACFMHLQNIRDLSPGAQGRGSLNYLPHKGHKENLTRRAMS